MNNNLLHRLTVAAIVLLLICSINPVAAHAAKPAVRLAAYSSYGYSEFFRNGAAFCRMAGHSTTGRGINIAVIHPGTGKLIECKNFDGWGDKANFNRLAEYVAAISAGHIVMAAISDEAGFIDYRTDGCSTPWQFAPESIEAGYRALENLGSVEIRKVSYWGTWAMIAIKDKGALAEAHHNPGPYGAACMIKGNIPPTRISAVVPLIQQ